MRIAGLAVLLVACHSQDPALVTGVDVSPSTPPPASARAAPSSSLAITVALGPTAHSVVDGVSAKYIYFATAGSTTGRAIERLAG